MVTHLGVGISMLVSKKAKYIDPDLNLTGRKITIMHTKNLLKFNDPTKMFTNLILAGSFQLQLQDTWHSLTTILWKPTHSSQFSFSECKSSWSQFLAKRKKQDFWASNSLEMVDSTAM